MQTARPALEPKEFSSFWVCFHDATAHALTLPWDGFIQIKIAFHTEGEGTRTPFTQRGRQKMAPFTQRQGKDEDPDTKCPD